MTGAGHRVFIAVNLDPTLLDAIGALERRLEEAGVMLRWIKAENLHFTLRFLGHITPAELSRARRAAHAAAEGSAAFRIRLAGLGVFPSVRRAQVIWVGVREGGEELKALAGRLDDSLARERFPKEPRSFKPHLTIARIREPGRLPPLEAAIAAQEGAEVGAQGVTSIVVTESRLRPSGALYIPVEEVPLPTHEK